MNCAEEVNVSHNVEISGWTANGEFFVTKTSMHWGEDDSRQVFLRQPLRDGAVLFVRWVDPVTGDNCFPVAYQVVRIDDSNRDEPPCIELRQIYPRISTPCPSGSKPGEPERFN